MREPKLPSDRDWERSVVLEPRPAPRHPELVGDGGGLPFPLATLNGTPEPLDPQDPAASALLAHLAARTAPKRASHAPWKRAATPPPTPPPPPSLDGWRELARTDSESLFALGRPPQPLTMAFRRVSRRRGWTHVGTSSTRPLRATRDGIRASSWRLDPTREAEPEDTILHVLVTEQAFAGGQRADGRILTPDIYVDERELVLTMFIAPRPGYQNATPNPQTPVRIALPQPVGARRLIDGALAQFSTPGAPPQEPAGGDS